MLPLYPELLWAALLLVNFAAILLAYRFFGRIGLFIWVPIAAILANIQVVKFVALFGFTTTLGNIVYSTSFLVTDILNENYGKRDARKAVAIGFFTLIIMALIMKLALLFPAHEIDNAHPHLEAIFSVMPRIAIASLIAYGISQLHDVWAYGFWKKMKPGLRFLWLRNNLSTMVSQLLDSVVFNTVAFYGEVPLPVLVEFILTTYVLKWMVAAADTPFLYLAARWKARGRIVEEGE